MKTSARRGVVSDPPVRRGAQRGTSTIGTERPIQSALSPRWTNADVAGSASDRTVDDSTSAAAQRAHSGETNDRRASVAIARRRLARVVDSRRRMDPSEIKPDRVEATGDVAKIAAVGTEPAARDGGTPGRNSSHSPASTASTPRREHHARRRRGEPSARLAQYGYPREREHQPLSRSGWSRTRAA